MPDVRRRFPGLKPHIRVSMLESRCPVNGQSGTSLSRGFAGPSPRKFVAARDVTRRSCMSSSQIWTYRDATITQRNLSGLSVEAIDGKIGKVDEATNESARASCRRHGAVDLREEGRPAGRVSATSTWTPKRVREPHQGPDQGLARVRRGQVPRTSRTAASYRDQLGSYYGTGGAGYRDDDLQ